MTLENAATGTTGSDERCGGCGSTHHLITQDGSHDGSVVYELVYRRGRRVLVSEEPGMSLETEEHALFKLDDKDEVGKVVWKGIVHLEEADVPETAVLMRRAEQREVDVQAARERREAEALDVFGEKIGEHDLPMDPLEVDFPGNGQPITFYFFAPHRVDFRELVRTLARIYRTRIELRQVSPRQRAQWAGGCGSCGRPFCCAAFMRSMPQVPTEAARTQALSHSSSKLIGRCGQLKCCLRYELDFYNQVGERFPSVGQNVQHCGQPCRVERLDIFHDKVQVRTDEGDVQELPLLDVEPSP